MDKAEIRAKSLELADELREQTGVEGMFTIEAALTAAYDQGWDEGVEAAANHVAEIQLRPGNADMGMWCDDAADEIRRLKKGKGV